MEANNVEAMREALRAALDLIFDMQNADRSPLSHQAYAVRRKIKAALARPLRECDVGTAKEQSERMAEFCKRQYAKVNDGSHICSKCRLHKLIKTECPFAWAQKPYTANKGGAE
jgi:hypothetical protein